eukprot:7843746-Lingulodinium_polyedra.AAC.1
MSLRIAQDWDTEQLQSAIRPDQSKWSPLWVSSLAGGSLRKLLRHLRFTESLELLSVFVRASLATCPSWRAPPRG